MVDNKVVWVAREAECREAECREAACREVACREVEWVEVACREEAWVEVGCREEAWVEVGCREEVECREEEAWVEVEWVDTITMVVWKVAECRYSGGCIEFHANVYVSTAQPSQ